MTEAPLLAPPAPPARDFATIVRRGAIWGVFFGLLYLLRPFFPILLLTFVFSYAAGRALAGLRRRFPGAPRRPLVAGIFLGGIGALVGLGFVLGPLVREEERAFRTKFPEMRENLARWIEEQRVAHPAALAAIDPENRFAREVREFDVDRLRERKAAESEASGSGVPVLTGLSPLVLDVAQLAFRVASTLFLSLLFSFLVVLDLPRIKNEVEAIRGSRIGWIYEEVRGTVVEFGATLGRTIESQAVIALANTLLTWIGLALLGVPSKFLLSTIVFLCSFIPVLGVFISTTPISLVALSTGGFGLVLKCVAMITLVHGIEAYVLNPRITGSYVHLNPVFVLIVLFVGEHLFGLWGLILGVPVAVTLLRRGRAIVRAPATV